MKTCFETEATDNSEMVYTSIFLTNLKHKMYDEIKKLKENSDFDITTI